MNGILYAFTTDTNTGSGSIIREAAMRFVMYAMIAPAITWCQ